MIKQLKHGFIFLCIFISCGEASAANSNQQPLDRIVAIVNDAVVTQTELQKAKLAMRVQMQGANLPVPSDDQLTKQVLDQVINRKLQLQAADQAGVKVKEDQVDKAINSIASGNGVSVTELYEKVTAQGLSKSEYRKEIRDEITLQQIEQQQVGSKIVMSPEDVKQFLHARAWQTHAGPAPKEYRIEDLVVLLPENASADALVKAKKTAYALASKARQGTSHQELAKAEAQNQSVEENDLGWRTLAEIPTAFVGAVGVAKKGAVLEPIQAANGFHIIRLTNTRTLSNKHNPSDAMPTAKQAQQMVYQRKMEVAIKKWVAKLRTQAFINTHPENAG
jgi:peptidyl-prolyl cis-trans isomerase SurA